MGDQVVETVVRLDIDRTAAKRVEDSTKRVTDLLATLKKQVKALDAEVKRESGFERVEKSSRGARQELDRLKAEVRKLDKEMASADGAKIYEERIKAAARASELYGDVGSRTRDIGGGIAALGGAAGQGIERKLIIGSDLLDAAEGFGRIKAEMPALIDQLDITPTKIAAVTAAAAATGIVYVALKNQIDDWKNAADKAKNTVNAQINALKNYYSFIEDATSSDVKARQDEIKKQQAANAQYLSDLEELRSAIESGLDVGQDAAALDKVAEGAIRAAHALGKVDFGLNDVKQAIEEVGAEQTTYRAELDLLSQSLLNGTTAANDMLAAEQELMNQRKEASKLALGDIDRSVNFASDLRKLMDTGTVASVTQEIDRLTAARDKEQRRLEQISHALQAGTITAEDSVIASAAAREEIETLNGQISDLTLFALSAATANDALAASLDRTKKRTLETAALRKVELDKRAALDAKAIEQEEAYNDALAQTRDKRAVEAAREAEDFALERIREMSDHYTELAEMDAEYARDRQDIISELQAAEQDGQQDQLDALSEYNKDAIKASRDSQKRLAQIQKDAERDIRSAALRLDEIAIFETQQNSEDELKAEADQYDEEKRQREDDYRERVRELERATQERRRDAAQQLRDLQDQHARERQENINAFNLQLQRENQNRAIALKRQQEDWNREDALAVAHYARQQADLNTAYAALENETRLGMNKVKLEFAKGLSALATNAGSTNVYSGTVSTVGRTKSYASGGYPPMHETVLVGERGPELAQFLSPVRVYSSGQGPNSSVVNSHNTNSVSFSRGESISEARIAHTVDRAMERFYKNLR